MKDNLWNGFYGDSYRDLLRSSAFSEQLSDVWSGCVKRHQEAPPGEGHWEFLATGYLQIVDCGGPLEEVHKRRLSAARQHFQRSPATSNWRLMQRVVERRLTSCCITARDLQEAGASQQPDGLLPDEPGTPSSQYHAYLLLLLVRFGDHTNAAAREVAVKAFDWLVTSDRALGDPSAIGRGRFQLFGYAAMTAAAHYARRWQISIDERWLSRVVARCLAESPEGAMSAIWSGPFRDWLLHGYNTRTDYPAFAELWLKDISTAALSRPRPTREEAAFRWWQPLEDRACGVLSGIDGPIAALLPAWRLPMPAGRRELLRQVLERRSRASIRLLEPRRIAAEQRVDLGGFTLRLSSDEFVLSSEPQSLQRSKVMYSPVLWTPATTRVHAELAGCVEESHLSWSRAGTHPWAGRSARIVRSGHVEYRWSS